MQTTALELQAQLDQLTIERGRQVEELESHLEQAVLSNAELGKELANQIEINEVLMTQIGNREGDEGKLRDKVTLGCMSSILKRQVWLT